jgi:radical SAM/Cys-rich protein
MDERVAERVLDVIAASPNVTTLDITGGAPELNPHFRRLVMGVRALGREIEVIDRCNLTVLLEPGMEDLAPFLADEEVHIIASLPCYLQENVDQQRGPRAYDRSIDALRRLNALGYGQAGSGLMLDLVYNPIGAALPPSQSRLEVAYKDELRQRFGIVFNRLYTITNMPIHRFAAYLEKMGQYDEYLSLLERHFNQATVPHLMCRTMISVGWEGHLYDCDFNQALQIELATGRSDVRTIWDLHSLDELVGGRIITGSHCLGCTAGEGSSCQGALG